MKAWLNKKKNWGHIDFIEVPLNWGRRNKEFIGFDLRNNFFFRIFFDNKYREDDYKKEQVDKQIFELEKELIEYEKGLSDIGVYNTRNEYQKIKQQLDFYKKYYDTQRIQN